MGLFDRFRRKNDVSDIQYQLASQREVISPKAIEGFVKPVAEQYLKAIYSQSETLLPGRKMGEELFSSACESIREDIKSCRRTCDIARITSSHLSGVDRTQMFSERGMDFTCVYEVSGTYNDKIFSERRKAKFCYRNDQRQGWILEDWYDYGKVNS